MYYNYYINLNAQENGDNEVHREDCSYLNLVSNKKLLGSFLNCHDAIIAAKRMGYSNADGCYYCSKPCHRS
ncbi:hypothetical protein M0Q39_00115 [Patescibacteria group bacterium]|nr:hypothetical protein [Patescibacteria group bacterium]